MSQLFLNVQFQQILKYFFGNIWSNNKNRFLWCVFKMFLIMV